MLEYFSRMPRPNAMQDPATGERWVFKNRGLLLVPVALVLVLFGSPSLRSAVVGITVAGLGRTHPYLGGRILRSDDPLGRRHRPQARDRGAVRVTCATPLRWQCHHRAWFLACILGQRADGHVDLAVLAVAALVIVGVYATIIPLEESYLAHTFGDEYETYRRAVPRIVPLSAPLPREERQGAWNGRVIARAEIITLVYFAAHGRAP